MYALWSTLNGYWLVLVQDCEISNRNGDSFLDLLVGYGDDETGEKSDRAHCMKGEYEVQGCKRQVQKELELLMSFQYFPPSGKLKGTV